MARIGKVVVIDEQDSYKFGAQCEELMRCGYSISSSYCGVMGKEYNYLPILMAILVHEEKEGE